jgi:hypothetical protein
MVAGTPAFFIGVPGIEFSILVSWRAWRLNFLSWVSWRAWRLGGSSVFISLGGLAVR